MKKLTDAQRKMLESARDHGNLYFHLSGRSAIGGATWIVMSLRKRELVDRDWHITDAGRAALAPAERNNGN